MKSGQRDRIKVTIPTRNRVGIVKRTIRISTNDPNHRSTTLTCSGRVNRPLKNPRPAVQARNALIGEITNKVDTKLCSLRNVCSARVVVVFPAPGTEKFAPFLEIQGEG